MKHLRVLEDAGLVTLRKVGREKFHFLNPIPIQRAYDRWVEKYARPWMSMIAGLKWSAEESHVAAKPAHVYQIYIQATPERVWQALTDPDITQHYYFGMRIESDFTPGSPYVYRTAEGTAMLEGTIVASDSPQRLLMTMNPVAIGAGATTPPSRVTYEITPHESQSKLVLIHEGLDFASEQGRAAQDGWTQGISALKTYLETHNAPVTAGD